MRYHRGAVVLIGVCLMAGHGAWAQQEPSAEVKPLAGGKLSDGVKPLGGAKPSVAAIVAEMQARNAERQRELESYTGERSYRVEYHGTGGEHHGEMNVHVVYDGFGDKHITVVSGSGSKLIQDRVLRRMIETEQTASGKAERVQTMLSPENYSFEPAGEESVDGVEAWVLRVAPKVENKLTYRGRVWVSKEDFAVMRVQGEPAKNPSWWINRASFDWRYGRHGRFWLPERTEAVSHVRIGGEAKLTIEYGEYRIVSERQGGVQVAQHTAR